MGTPTYGVKLVPNVLRILREKSIKFNAPPTPEQVSIALDYIGGKTAKEIIHETGQSLEAVLQALKRTRDDIRRGNATTDAIARFPKVVAWQREKYPLEDSPAQVAATKAEAPADIFETPPGEIAKQSLQGALAKAGVKVTDKVKRQIQAIAEYEYTKMDPENPETITKFMAEVRANVLRIVMPLSGQLLAAELASGNAMTTGLEVSGLLPKGGKGITIAQQFNLPGADDKHKRLRSGMGFERLLDQGDKIIEAGVVK